MNFIEVAEAIAEMSHAERQSMLTILDTRLNDVNLAKLKKLFREYAKEDDDPHDNLINLTDTINDLNAEINQLEEDNARLSAFMSETEQFLDKFIEIFGAPEEVYGK